MPVFIPNEGVPIDFSQFSYSDISAEGLAVIGANFHPETLVNAYCSGLFPWYIDSGLPHWFCPDPRMVLFPEHLVISKSMRNVFNQKKFDFSCDTCFDQVIRSCADVKRKHDDMTWIDHNFIGAYNQLHDMGLAHSFEAWQDGNLVGGLYGVAIGQVFFGESMFSIKPNASKAAFIQAVRFLSLNDFKLIDCQVYTEHLSSLGAMTISRDEFIFNYLVQLLPHESLNERKWTELFVR